MFVPNLEAIDHVTLVLGPENRLASVKSGLIQKRLKYGKKYFTRLYSYVLIPFHPKQPTFGRDEVHFFFVSFFFFLPKFCTLFFS